MRKIAVFYHCLFCLGDPPELLPNAFWVVGEQMGALRSSGLLNAATEMTVGINGGDESREYANLLIPPKAKRKMHGLQSRSENLTIVEIENWAKKNPGWAVLYFHSKGATHPVGEPLRTRWRECMMRNLVINWNRCVNDLSLYESVGCHWYCDMHGRSYWAGTFWWARSEYLQTLPSITVQPTVVIEGISSLNARYEAEVWIGGGPKLPSRRDYHPEGFTKC